MAYCVGLHGAGASRVLLLVVLLVVAAVVEGLRCLPGSGYRAARSPQRNQFFSSRSGHYITVSRGLRIGPLSGSYSPYNNSPNPDQPTPEINPTRRDPDEPTPHIPVHLPTVSVGNTNMDINSRLLKDRIIMIGDEVNDEMANIVVAQLLYLHTEDPAKQITMYINSPGGSISSGMAIFDTMQYISCNVSTICFGMAASMGAFLLGAGTKGLRKALPNARIMLHQPLGNQLHPA
jgi:hypothetical protein